MGLTNPESLAGGTLKVFPDLADKAIKDRVATRLGLDITTTAWGIRTVANSSLIRALRAVSTERGRDPRRFVLFAFGGMGPVHAVDLAREFGMTKVIVPILPGLFSALGLLFSEVEHHLIQTHYAMTSEIDFERVNGVIGGLAGEARSYLDREGYDDAHRALELSADTRYSGQDYALTIPLESERLDAKSLDALREAFHREHDKTYGYRSDAEEVQIVALRALARGLSEVSRVPPTLKVTEVAGWKPSGDRKAFFGSEVGWVTSPVIGRKDLAEKASPGPMIIEEDNSLTLVPPDWNAALDEWSNIVVEPK